MADPTAISRETSLAVRLLLARLDALAPPAAPRGHDPRSILLAVPEDGRGQVVEVLHDLRARAGNPDGEGLASAARLLLEAARELWTLRADENADGGPNDREP